MAGSTSTALTVFGLVGLSAATVGGWSMYYMEKQDHEAETAQLAAEIRNQQRHIDSLVSKSDLLSSKSSELETSVDALKQERDSLIEDMQSVKTEQDRLETKQNHLSSNLETATTEQERLEGEQKDLSSNLASAVTEQERLASEGEELSQNLESVMTEREGLQSNLQAAQSEHDRLAKQLTFMLSVRDQLSSDLEATKKDRDRIKADLDQKIQAKENELSELVNRIEGMSTQLTEASGKIGNLETEVNTLGKERDEIRARFAELKQELESDLHSKNIEIEQLKGDLTVIRLGSDILFDTGSSHLREEGRNALGHIAAALNDFPDRQVSLEGHTDSVPISERLQDAYATNWELSTARAARAVRYLQKQGVSPERLRAVGYGPYRPVADNDDPAARGLNRRLEIMLLPLNQTVMKQSLSDN
ncbi:MAG: OmpA family protein [Arenicellales bacterium]|nr:OmpA family protein [Arenicellales bacterium]